MTFSIGLMLISSDTPNYLSNRETITNIQYTIKIILNAFFEAICGLMIVHLKVKLNWPNLLQNRKTIDNF